MRFTPEYMELCRLHPMQRTLEQGDWSVTCGHGQTIGPNLCHAGGLLLTGPLPKEPLASVYWLPRLDQLYDLLEAAGAEYVRIWGAGSYRLKATTHFGPETKEFTAEASSREEAAYRVYRELSHG